jgi:hypothetical protein
LVELSIPGLLALLTELHLTAYSKPVENQVFEAR